MEHMECHHDLQNIFTSISHFFARSSISAASQLSQRFYEVAWALEFSETFYDQIIDEYWTFLLKIQNRTNKKTGK